MRCLKAELKCVTEARDILKKAAVYFAKTSGYLDYIEMSYHRKHRHSFGNDSAPDEYEKRYFHRLSSVYKIHEIHFSAGYKA